MIAMVLALGIGAVAGSRTMIAPTAVSWAASLGWLTIQEKRLRFLTRPVTPRFITALALGELIGDKLPATPSRTMPGPFAARIVSGALSGYVIGQARGERVSGVLGGIIGAVVGTLGGRVARGLLAGALGRDWPAALLEDATAILAAGWIVKSVRGART
ncbi:MAG: DUF4126 family protein [Chloroflexota bacterium]